MGFTEQPPLLARATPEGGSDAPNSPPAAPPRAPQAAPQKPAAGRKSGGGPEPGGGGGDAGGPPELPPQQRRLVALLVEYGGLFGTAACILGFFLKIDPFGSFHWDAADALLGVKLFVPLLLLDALIMLPDYSARDDQADQVSRLLFGPAGLALNAGDGPSGSKDGGASSSSGSQGSSGSSGASGSGSKVGPSGGAGPRVEPPPLSLAGPEPPPLLRAQLALELLQSFNTRANPGIGLPPWQEGLVVAVGTLADEMLYRAVALTFLAGWLKDRFFEAGFDDDVALGAAAAMPTSEFSKYVAMGLVAALGISGFVAKAYQDKKMVERVQILTADGKQAGEKADSIKAQLVASMERQNQIIYFVEGVREVSLGVASGLAFIWTGNLAAPYAGSLLMQSLFSGYQRFCLARQRRRRKEALARMQQRSSQVRDAIAAAVAAKKAREGGGGGAGTEQQQEQEQQQQGGRQLPGGDGEGAGAPPAAFSGGGGEQGVDERLSPAAKVMLSDLEFKRRASAAEAAEREADLAEIRAALLDEPAGPSGGGGGGGGGGAGAAAAAESEADARLSALLTDMMRSPEGRGVVKRFKEASGSGGGGAAEDDVSAYIDSLLSDPDVKARLVRELEARLCEMAEREAEGKAKGGGGGGEGA